MADAFFSSSWAQSVLGEQNPRAHRRRCTKHNTDQGRHRHSRSCLDVQQRDDCAAYRPRRSQNPRLAADESSRRSALTRGWLPPGYEPPQSWPDVDDAAHCDAGRSNNHRHHCCDGVRIGEVRAALGGSARMRLAAKRHRAGTFVAVSVSSGANAAATQGAGTSYRAHKRVSCDDPPDRAGSRGGRDQLGANVLAGFAMPLSRPTTGRPIMIAVYTAFGVRASSVQLSVFGIRFSELHAYVGAHEQWRTATLLSADLQNSHQHGGHVFLIFVADPRTRPPYRIFSRGLPESDHSSTTSMSTPHPFSDDRILGRKPRTSVRG